MVSEPPKEFGKRRPLPPASSEPPKRSSHVALLLMGTLSVGGTAYALMPVDNCTPPSPGMAAPALPQTGGTSCASRTSSGGSGGGSGRSLHLGFFGGGDSSERSSSPSSSSGTASGQVTRGGFGGFAHAFGFSGSG